MNTEKIKLELNSSELKALFTMLNSLTRPDEEILSYIMAVYITSKIVKKIVHRLSTPPLPGKNAKISLHIAEGIALITLLLYADPALTFDSYYANLILKINNIVKQKLV